MNPIVMCSTNGYGRVSWASFAAFSALIVLPSHRALRETCNPHPAEECRGLVAANAARDSEYTASRFMAGHSMLGI
jgi:hypothetical protein